MENKLQSSVKIEQPEVCVGQETHSWSPDSSSLSIQEHSQKWPYDSIDMKVVKQELLDVPSENRSHRISKMVDIVGGSFNPEMTEHRTSESIMIDNSCKASIKHENCQMSENVSSVIDTNNKLSLAIGNCKQENKEKQERHTQNFGQSLDDIFDYVSYSSQRTNTRDLSDVSSQNVCVDRYERTHSEGMSNKCNEWEGLLIQDDHLECQTNMKHRRTHTREKPYKCDVCGASFIKAGHLKDHKRTHTGERPYKCDDCGASFTQPGNLRRHKRTHTGEKPYKCDVCGASFTQTGSLAVHKRRHIAEKPYKCDDCGASFTRADYLKDHKRTHTGVRPYTCDICGASFTQTGNLAVHKRRHIAEKPYKCDDCGASFIQAGKLKRHKRTHTVERPYKCDGCGGAFTRAGHLKDHKRTHSGERERDLTSVMFVVLLLLILVV